MQFCHSSRNGTQNADKHNDFSPISNRAITNVRQSSLIQLKSNCTCGGSCPSCRSDKFIQAKLKIGAHDDKYEKEADQVADQVMRMPANVASGENHLGAKKVESAESKIQPSSISGANEYIESPEQAQKSVPAVPPNFNSSLQSLGVGGQALSVAERQFFEPRFGADFSSIKIHSGKQAQQLAGSINARAFTLGSHIVFGAGEYSPDSTRGQHLMAHELTHTLQQNSQSSTNTIQREEGGGNCSGENTRNYLLRNFENFEFTVPSGCRSRSTFTAKWVYDGDCCTGRAHYEVINNGRSHRLPAGPNVCGEGDATSRVGHINTGSGRQRFRINVDRQSCEGIRMDISVRTQIR